MDGKTQTLLDGLVRDGVIESYVEGVKDDDQVEVSIELDIYHDKGVPLNGVLDDMSRELGEDHDVRMVVLREFGPSGWPLVRFTGTKADLRRLVKIYDPTMTPDDVVVFPELG